MIKKSDFSKVNIICNIDSKLKKTGRNRAWLSKNTGIPISTMYKKMSKNQPNEFTPAELYRTSVALDCTMDDLFF